MRKRTAFFLFAIFILFWSTLLTLYNPERIVDSIGVTQGYVVAFLVALFGGVSTFTSASYHATIATLVAGGLRPWLLGLVAGLGLVISDAFFFYFGRTGTDILPHRARQAIDRFSGWLSKRSDTKVGIVIFLYAGVTPLPNDVLTVSLGLAGYPLRKILLPLLLGDILYSILFAYASLLLG